MKTLKSHTENATIVSILIPQQTFITDQLPV